MPFDAIFCDEVQDLPISFIVSIRAACKHLIIAGDAAQTIYSEVPQFKLPPTTLDQIKSEINCWLILIQWKIIDIPNPFNYS